MEPEDIYSQFRSVIPGMPLSMPAALWVTQFRWKNVPRCAARDHKFVRGQGVRMETESISQILEELLSCSSCFHQSAFQSASLNKSSTPAVFPRGPVKLVVVLASYTAENLSLCIREYPIMKFH